MKGGGAEGGGVRFKSEGGQEQKSHSCLSGGKFCKHQILGWPEEESQRRGEVVLVPAPTSELLAGEGERAGQGQESHSFLSEGSAVNTWVWGGRKRRVRGEGR